MSTISCCIKGCSNMASLQHVLTGQFWQYVHNYCSTCYQNLMERQAGIEIDRTKVPLVRLPEPTVDFLSLGQVKKD